MGVRTTTKKQKMIITGFEHGGTTTKKQKMKIIGFDVAMLVSE
jgi:hypothetical protein